MNRIQLTAAIVTLAVGAGMAQAASVPTVINFQGTATNASGDPIATGTHTLEFRVHNATSGGDIWGPQIFDGNPGVGHGPRVTVLNGRFNVILGPVDTSNRPISSVFSDVPRYISALLDGTTWLAPRQQVFSAAHAIQAGDADLLGDGAVWKESGVIRVAGDLRSNGEIEATAGGFKFPDGRTMTKVPVSMGGNVVVVAKSGGQFTSIQAAINSITDESSTNPYTIWIAPGVYNEGNSFDMEDYVSLLGSGQESTTISLAGTNGALIGDSHVTIQNLTVALVRTGGSGSWVGLSTGYGIVDLLLKDVRLDTRAAGDSSYGVYCYGSGEFKLENVTIIGSQYGVRVTSDASGPTIELRNCHIETRNIATAVGFEMQSTLTNDVRVYDSTIKGVYYSLMGPGTVHAYGCCLGGTNLTSTADLHLCYGTNYAPLPDQ